MSLAAALGLWRELYGWAWYRSIKAINAAGARLGLQHSVTLLTLIEPLQGICRHGFPFLEPAFRAGNVGFQNNLLHRNYSCLISVDGYPASCVALVSRLTLVF